MLVAADKNTFDAHTKTLCIADFYTSGCPTCERLAPVFAQAATRHTGCTFAKVNLDEDITLAERFGITHVPTIIRFVQGQPVATHVGFLTPEELDAFIQKEEL